MRYFLRKQLSLNLKKRGVVCRQASNPLFISNSSSHHLEHLPSISNLRTPLELLFFFTACLIILKKKNKKIGLYLNAYSRKSIGFDCVLDCVWDGSPVGAIVGIDGNFSSVCCEATASAS